MSSKQLDDNKALSDLLQNGNMEEAKKIIDKILKGDLTDAQKGEVYANVVTAGMKAETAANAEYEKFLDNAIATLKGMDQNIEVKETDDGIANARKKLNI